VKCLAACLLLVLMSIDLLAQQTDPLPVVEDHFYPTSGEEDTRGDQLVQTMAHPIDLNRARAEDLRSIRLLHEHQIQQLLAHRDQHGPLLSIYELQVIPGFDAATIRNLLPWITVRPIQRQSLWHHLRKPDTHYLLWRYETVRQNTAQDNPRWTGSPHQLDLRFRMRQPELFSIGFTGSKDAGEPLQWKPRSRWYGFDFWSAHIQVRDQGRLRNLIVGDFQGQFAQGLLLGMAWGVGKNSETIGTVRRHTLGWQPYAGTNPGAFWRGVALDIQLTKHLYCLTGWGRQPRDATVVSTATGSIFRSRIISGLHRSDTEMASRHQLREYNQASYLIYRKRWMEGGLGLHTTTFSLPWVPSPSLYQPVPWTGKQLGHVGLHAQGTSAYITWFVEYIQQLQHRARGWIGGMLINLHPSLDMALLHRHYDTGLTLLYSNALAENSTPRNENGLYWGWKYSARRKKVFSGYVDLFAFPGMRYRAYRPSAGHEILLRMQVPLSPQTTLTGLVRAQYKEINVSPDAPVYQTAPQQKRTLNVLLQHQPARTLTLRTRLQASTCRVGTQHTRGFSLAQDISLKLRRLKASARYAVFDADDADNRQYIFENDVWLSYGFTAYSGTGIRKYILLEYAATPRVTLWLRYATVRYSRPGEPEETIAGNIKNDVKFETRFRF